MNDRAKARTGWIFYDVANSAFATSVLTVIFSVYYANILVPPGGARIGSWRVPGESLWGYMISAVMAATLVGSLWLGSLADRRGLKRTFLIASASLGSFCTMALWWAKPGTLWLSTVWVFLATLAFELSLVFYNAFLNDLSTEKDAGRLSGLGFAWGYVGGGVCLALNMIMIAKPGWFGLAGLDRTLAVRWAMFLVGIWWLVFSIPTFAWVRDRPLLPSGTLPRSTWAELRETWVDLRRRPDLFRFLLSYLVFNDGIQTVLLMASIFGAKALGLSTTQLGLCFLVIQFVAFAGSLYWGPLADRRGHRNVILWTLLMYSGVTIWGIVMRSAWEFWALGIGIGLVMGGSQAAARSLYSLLIPAEKVSEFFALFSIVGKASSLLGPFVFGAMAQAYGLRAGVASLLLFFVLGGALLLTVNETRGRALGG